MNLNWGCGPILRDGWLGSDRDDHGQEHVGNLLEGLPWPAGSFEIIVANHSLQQLDYHELVPGLQELRRVLANGGVLRVLVPDVLRAVTAYTHGDRDWFPVNVDDEPTVGGALSAYMTWFGTNKTCFTPPFLHDVLHRAGFGVIAPCAVGMTRLGNHTGVTELDDRAGESLVVEASP